MADSKTKRERRPEQGYQSQYTGIIYAQDELDGLGNPPRDPAVPPGMGAGLPMLPFPIEVEREYEVGAGNKLVGGEIVAVRHIGGKAIDPANRPAPAELRPR